MSRGAQEACKPSGKVGSSLQGGPHTVTALHTRIVRRAKPTPVPAEAAPCMVGTRRGGAHPLARVCRTSPCHWCDQPWSGAPTGSGKQYHTRSTPPPIPTTETCRVRLPHHLTGGGGTRTREPCDPSCAERCAGGRQSGYMKREWTTPEAPLSRAPAARSLAGGSSAVV